MISHPGRGGLHQLLGVSSSPCCRFHPAEVEMPHRSDFDTPCCLRPTEAGSALGSRPFEATSACTFVTARRLVVSPRETLSIGFRTLVSRHPAIRTTGRLTFAPAGLSPAEHTSLYWTHSRTARFPGSGSKHWPIIRGPSQGLERFKRWVVCTPTTPGLPTALPPEAAICVCAGFIRPGRLADREGRQVSRAPLPNSGVTSVGET